MLNRSLWVIVLHRLSCPDSIGQQVASTKASSLEQAAAERIRVADLAVDKEEAHLEGRVRDSRSSPGPVPPSILAVRVLVDSVWLAWTTSTM